MNNKIRRIIANILYLVSILILVFLDQITKYFAVELLQNKSDFILIPGVLQFHYLENTGAAFSILEGKQLFFSIITPILILALLYVLFKMPASTKYTALNCIIVFVIAGAVGNYIDRIINHYVVDFIYFSLINFPVFNIADCYVTVSIILFFILILFYYKDEDLEQIKTNLRFRKNG